jgi:acetoin utilization deacetylase AcuC-like enzyme
VLILDWDVHHGNGTNDIFHRDPDVLYVSIHESPLYPGTGPAGDVGSGPGEGYTVNLPVPAGSGDAAWCSLGGARGRDARHEYRPGPHTAVGGLRRAPARSRSQSASSRATGYAQMAASMRGLADELDVPLGVVLEGGYDPSWRMAESYRSATLEVVGAEDPAERPPRDAALRWRLQAAGRLAGALAAGGDGRGL